MLAIDNTAGAFYEGNPQIGIPIWPMPFVSVATVLRTESDANTVPDLVELGSAQLVFREDYFDPVTRVRRGRFYNRGDGSQPMLWSVQVHPAVPSDARSIGAGGLIRKHVFGFYDWHARTVLREKGVLAKIALGTQRAMTIWRVLSIEQISSGEDLVTLKAVSSLGILPDLAGEAIPFNVRDRVLSAAENLTDTAFRAGADSTIDRCRDLASLALGHYFETVRPGASQLDLAKLGSVAEEQKRFLLANAAKLLALLHSRTKPSEQAKRNILPPSDDDAALAIECIGLVLRELEWGRRSL